MKKNKLDKVYLIVFLILEFIIIVLFEYFDIPDIKIFIITQVIFVILFSVVYFLITLFIEKMISRKFCVEYNKIMREYQKTDDAKVFYDKLKNMKEQPVTQDIKNTYFLSMATAAYKNGENKEALEYLDMMQTDDEHILKVIEDESQIATDDADNNIRYIGANPNNYVYFNCSDYNSQSDATCEKWRIIGVFKNMTKEDGSQADLVKIVRESSLGNFYWDYKKKGVGTSTSDWGSNDWTDSQLMMMLNPTDYLKSGYTIDNNIVKDSKGQAIYQNMGSYYNGTSGCEPAEIASGTDFTCTSIDFTSTGLKNDLTRNAIESVVWNLGGTASYNSARNGLASHWYGYERGTKVYSGRPTTWTGKIALMYPSDYGYATAGGTTTNRASCLAKELYNWDGSGVSDCKNNDYLFKSAYTQWTLAPYSSYSSYAFFVGAGGGLSTAATTSTFLMGFVPRLI